MNNKQSNAINEIKADAKKQAAEEKELMKKVKKLNIFSE